MRCYICNRVIDEPQFNAEHKDIDPCDPCKAVIADTLAGFGDLPAEPEEASYDASGLDPLILEGLYPTYEDPFETEDLS